MKIDRSNRGGVAVQAIGIRARRTIEQPGKRGEGWAWSPAPLLAELAAAQETFGTLNP